MNEYQKERFVQRMLDAMHNTISGKQIAILGFAFKKDTNDARESPAISICKRLLEEKGSLKIYDPQVTKDSVLSSLGITDESSLDRLSFCNSPEDACAGTHAIAILTEWDEFKEIDYEKVLTSMLRPAHIFDGRNLLDLQKLKGMGYRAFGIGKV